MKAGVTKAVITCGGYATRFLPISKAVPKELMPVGDKPVIHYIVNELTEAGITDILILLGRGREALVNYFDRNPEIDSVAEQKNLTGSPFGGVNIWYRRVPMPKGAADCVWHAKSFIGADPFIVAYCDDIFFEANPTKELIKDFKSFGKSAVIGVCVPPAETGKYGIIKSEGNSVIKIVEKPKSDAPSNIAAAGRYLLLPKIFELIEQDFGSKTEICMTEQFDKLAGKGELRVVNSRAKRFDTGTPDGLLEANIFASGRSGI